MGLVSGAVCAGSSPAEGATKVPGQGRAPGHASLPGPGLSTTLSTGTTATPRGGGRERPSCRAVFASAARTRGSSSCIWVATSGVRDNLHAPTRRAEPGSKSLHDRLPGMDPVATRRTNRRRPTVDRPRQPTRRDRRSVIHRRGPRCARPHRRTLTTVARAHAPSPYFGISASAWRTAAVISGSVIPALAATSRISAAFRCTSSVNAVFCASDFLRSSVLSTVSWATIAAR